MANYTLLHFSNADELVRAAATAWLDEIESAKRAGNLHTVALSGGRVAQKFFSAATEAARQRQITFDHVHFFWGDERCVPSDDQESNYRLAAELLLAPLGIPSRQIHRIRGEESPEIAAAAAENEFRSILCKNPTAQPVLDLVLLGVGEDGHIASLFPPAPANNLDTSVSFLVVKNSPKPPPTRISLSYKAIIDAKRRWVLASGVGKLDAVRDSLTGDCKKPLGYLIGACPVKIFTDLPKF